MNPPDLKFEIGHVLFIDIVGYSKLNIHEQSEQLDTLTAIVRGSEQFKKSEAERKLLRLPTGDGGALVFRTTSEAPVLCALEIAKALRAHPELQVRMGIHSGPVNEITDLNEQANIAGAGINIAQRVMDCGDAGHILLSKHVADDLEHYPRWQPYLHPLGECEVKHGARIGVVNLHNDEAGNPRPPKKLQAVQQRRARRRWSAIVIVLLLLSAIVVAFVMVSKKSARSTSAAPEKSIAVLPFVNMSADKENEFFADGLSEEILNSLARIDGMRVVGRTSSFQFKGKTEDLRAIGQKLATANVLEGSVRREGQRARITAQLVRTSDGTHLWSQTYDRTLTDTLAVQLNIAEQVAAVLDVVLDDKQREEMRAAGVKNVGAFIHYQKGLKLYADAHNPARSNNVIDGLRAANKEFDNAIALEPGFSQAYFAAGDLYDHIIIADDRPDAERRDAQQQLLHYLELAAANSHDEQQRLLTLADRQLVDDDWHGLAARIDAALRAPGCSAPDWLPVFASIFGYGDLIEDLGGRISVCDPLNAINFNNRVRAALAAGKPERALTILAAAERANSSTRAQSAYRVQALLMSGHVDQAKAELSKLEPTGEEYCRARLMVGLATGESAAGIHAALQGVDRSKSLYKMWKMNDLIEAALMGDRATANRLAAEIDKQAGSGLVLAVIVSSSLCGAPFDLEATPRFKARLAESGLPWPTIQALKLPPRTPASNP